MKNKFVFLISTAILFVSVLGCSYYNPLQGNTNSAANDNRTITDKAIDSTLGGEKTGVAECDEIIEFFAEQARSPDDDFITKAAKEYAIGELRTRFKQSLEQHRGDKQAMAKDCREFKTQLDKFRTEQSNQKQ